MEVSSLNTSLIEYTHWSVCLKGESQLLSKAYDAGLLLHMTYVDEIGRIRSQVATREALYSYKNDTINTIMTLLRQGLTTEGEASFNTSSPSQEICIANNWQSVPITPLHDPCREHKTYA